MRVKFYIKKALIIGFAFLIIFTNVCSADTLGVSMSDVQNAINDSNADTVHKLVTTDESNIIDNTVNATVTVDENDILTEASTIMVGTSGGGTQFDKFWNEDHTDLSEAFYAVIDKVYNIPLGRTVINANLTNWMALPANKKKNKFLDNIGIQDWDPKFNFSAPVEEAEKFQECPLQILEMYRANPELKMIVTIDMRTSLPEETLNFVHFCLDPNDSSEWAKLRKSWGFETPINLIAMEMNNEMYFTKTPEDMELAKKKTDWYVETFKKHMNAVQAEFPQIEFMPTINSNSTRGGYYEWNRPVLQGLAEYINIISFHLYYSGYELAYTYKWIQDTLDLIEEVAPGKLIKFAFTEHAKWDTDSYGSRQALSGILPYAHFYNRMIPKKFLHSTNAFNYRGTTWGFVRYQDDDTIQVTGLNEMHKVYEQNLGDRVLNTTVESDSPLTDENSTAQRLTVLVTAKGKKELKIFICNRERFTDFDLNFKFNNNYTLKEEVVFTAPNACSLVYDEATKDIFTTTTTAKNEPNFSSYKMPTKSLVCLTLESDKPLLQLSEGDEEDDDDNANYEGEHVFNDINGYWAENQIYILHDAGIINGLNADTFAPNAPITKGDFAVLLYRTLKDDRVVNKLHFNDIDDSDYRYEAINFLVNRGIIRLNNDYNLDDKMDIISAISMIYRADNTNIKAPQDRTNLYNQTNLSQWEKNVLNYEIDNGILKYFYEVNYLNPLNKLTRGEAASIIYRVYNSIEKYNSFSVN